MPSLDHDRTQHSRAAIQLHDILLELQRLATTTGQAEERASVAEEQASAAVTASAWSGSPSRRKIKLSNRDTEEFWPETYTADRVDNKSFAEFLGEVETYLSVLAPGLLARPMLELAAALRDQAVVTSDVEAYEVAQGSFRLELEGGVGGAWTLSAHSVQRKRRSQAQKQC